MARTRKKAGGSPQIDDEEGTKLLMKFIDCSEGYNLLDIIDAAARMLSGAIIFQTREVGQGRAVALRAASAVGASLKDVTAQQWDGGLGAPRSQQEHR